MKINLLISAMLMLLGSTLLSAQCDHLQTDDSGSSCETATFICAKDLHLHQGTLSDTLNQSGPNPLCNNNSQADNIKWYQFAVCEPYVELLITPSNCTTVITSGVPQSGLQAGIYSDCDFTESLACNTNGNIAPFTLSGNNFEPNSLVYLFLDGMSGSVCDYQIEIIAGIDTSSYDIQSDSLAVPEDGMVIGDAPDPCTFNTYNYYFTLPTCVGNGTGSGCGIKDSLRNELTCHEWIITPDTGYVFIGDSTAAEININWILPGTYTINVIIHRDNAISGCGAGIFECGVLNPLTINVSPHLYDFLDPIYLCEGDEFFYCGQFYYNDTDAYCPIDECLTEVQPIFFIPASTIDLGQIEVCAPSSCYELQGVTYCDPGLYTVLDNSSQCEAYFTFEIIQKSTIINDAGSQYVCSGTSCFSLYGVQYCDSGSYSIEDPNSICPTFTEFEIINLLELPLSLTTNNDHIDCINNSAELEAQFNTNGYSGNISYNWFDDSGNLVAQGSTFTTSYGGYFTCHLSFPDLGQSCGLDANVLISENTEQVIVNLNYEELNCGTTETIVSYTSNQNIASHFWEGQNGFSSSSPNPTITEGGQYEVTFVADNGCQLITQFEVEENTQEPISNFYDYDYWNCNTTEMVLKLELPSNHLTVIWDSADGLISDINDEQIEISQPGTYTATIIDPDTECEYITSATIINDPDMLLDFESSSTDIFCKGADDGLISIDNIMGGTGPFTSSINGVFSEDLEFDLLAPGTYEIVLADANGCEIIHSIEIIAYPELVIEIPEEIEVIYGSNHSFSIEVSDLSRVASISWIDQYGELVGEGQTISYTVMEDLQLTILIEDIYGCNLSREIIITLRHSDQVYIPNVFSPNADGVNDFFTLFSIPSTGKIEALDIYDRWGNLVFNAEDLGLNEEGQGWNGIFNGKPLPNAVYVYQARVNNGNNQLEDYKGTVTLIR